MPEIVQDSYDDHVERVRTEAERIFEAIGVERWSETAKQQIRNTGERHITKSRAFTLTIANRVEGWFEVEFDGNSIPFVVSQQYTNRGTWDTSALTVTRSECSSDDEFIRRVREALVRRAQRTPR